MDDLWNAVVCFQPPNLFIGKVWVPVMHFCVSQPLQSPLESGQEARIVPIDFSAALVRVNRLGILGGYWRFCLVYIDTVSIKTITAGYGEWVIIVSGVPQGCVLGALFPPL